MPPTSVFGEELTSGKAYRKEHKVVAKFTKKIVANSVVKSLVLGWSMGCSIVNKPKKMLTLWKQNQST